MQNSLTSQTQIEIQLLEKVFKFCPKFCTKKSLQYLAIDAKIAMNKLPINPNSLSDKYNMKDSSESDINQKTQNQVIQQNH